jgi:hypothetical protein
MVAVLLACGCAGSVVERKPVAPVVATTPPSPASVGWSPAVPPVDPPPPTPSPDQASQLPPLCQQLAQPLDPRAQQMLLALEQDLIARVLSGPSEAVQNNRGFNVDEVGWNLHQYPKVEMVFLFPIAVPIPMTAFRVRVGRRMDELKELDHTAFYLELSGVQMVRNGADTGLIVDYGAGPTGKKTVRGPWMWGMWGRFCAVPRRGGGWVSYAVGSVAVSML